MLKPNLGCSDRKKLNQWKIWKAEPMEILHQPLCTFKCRKVIMCECAHITVLGIGTSSCLNVETKPRMKWWQENWTNGKFALAIIHFRVQKGHHIWMSMHKCFKHSHAWMLKANLGCSGVMMGKLNQWKICISHYALLSVERSSHMNVMHKCFKHSHAWMLKPNQGCSGMVMEKLNQWKICISYPVLFSAERSPSVNFHT